MLIVIDQNVGGVSPILIYLGKVLEMTLAKQPSHILKFLII